MLLGNQAFPRYLFISTEDRYFDIKVLILYGIIIPKQMHGQNQIGKLP